MAEKKTPAESVLEVIPAVMGILRQEFRSQRGPNLTLPEFRALAYINRHPGCSLNEVAEHIGLEPPSTSKRIEALVRRAMIAREADDKDRRRVQLRILPEGKQRIEQARAHTLRFLTEQLAHLSTAEQQQLLDSLHLLQDAFARVAPQERKTP